MFPRYYYCPDFDTYVKWDGGAFRKIVNGRLEIDKFFEQIIMSDIYSEDISEREFNAKLFESADSSGKSS